MNWKQKAALLRILSALPGGRQIHYVMQRFLSRSLPLNDQDFLDLRVENAMFHFRNFRTFCPEADPASAHAFEFGAGWDLGIPLLLAALGMGKQSLYDLHPHARISLMRHTWKQLRRHCGSIQEKYNCGWDEKRLSIDRLPDFNQMPGRLGIRYYAPADARQTQLPNDSIDLCSSSSTLEHIPAREISAILTEMHRILKPEGILSCVIDLQDHYAYTDPGVSPYHFLRFSAQEWRRFNPSLHFQNRLQQPEYRKLFEEAGFEIIYDICTGPDEANLKSLETQPIHSDFSAGFSLTSIGIRIWEVVARKR